MLIFGENKIEYEEGWILDFGIMRLWLENINPLLNLMVLLLIIIGILKESGLISLRPNCTY